MFYSEKGRVGLRSLQRPFEARQLHNSLDCVQSLTSAERSKTDQTVPQRGEFCLAMVAQLVRSTGELTSEIKLVRKQQVTAPPLLLTTPESNAAKRALAQRTLDKAENNNNDDRTDHAWRWGAQAK
ncbi:MAG: hypothetical protein AAF687_00755 [Pseudomonadota bacterium]